MHLPGRRTGIKAGSDHGSGPRIRAPLPVAHLQLGCTSPYSAAFGTLAIRSWRAGLGPWPCWTR